MRYIWDHMKSPFSKIPLFSNTHGFQPSYRQNYVPRLGFSDVTLCTFGCHMKAVRRPRDLLPPMMWGFGAKKMSQFVISPWTLGILWDMNGITWYNGIAHNDFWKFGVWKCGYMMADAPPFMWNHRENDVFQWLPYIDSSPKSSVQSYGTAEVHRVAQSGCRVQRRCALQWQAACEGAECGFG